MYEPVTYPFKQEIKQPGEFPNFACYLVGFSLLFFVITTALSAFALAHTLTHTHDMPIFHNDYSLPSTLRTPAQCMWFEDMCTAWPAGRENVFGNLEDPYARIEAGQQFRVVLANPSGAFTPLYFEHGTILSIDESGMRVALPALTPFGNFIASDSRIKTGVEDMPVAEAWRIITGLKPRLYNYTEKWHEMSGPSVKRQRYMGFLAQEMEQTLPCAVIKDTANLGDGFLDDMRLIKYERLWAPVISVLQDLEQRISALEK